MQMVMQSFWTNAQSRTPSKSASQILARVCCGSGVHADCSVSGLAASFTASPIVASCRVSVSAVQVQCNAGEAFALHVHVVADHTI